jgi:hypothetical protein
MKIYFTFEYGFQKKVCTSKAPTFFSRQPLGVIFGLVLNCDI